MHTVHVPVGEIDGIDLADIRGIYRVRQWQHGTLLVDGLELQRD